MDWIVFFEELECIIRWNMLKFVRVHGYYLNGMVHQARNYFDPDRRQKCRSTV